MEGDLVSDSAVRRSQRRPLSRQLVLDSALDLVDEHGLAELTMRRLGTALDVEGMSLYKHVAHKDALLDGIVELLWGEVPADPAPDTDWRDALRAFGAGLREVFVRHPNAAPLMATRNFINPQMLRLYDAYSKVLERSGFNRGWALGSVGVVAGHALGYALMERSCLGSEPDTERPVGNLQRIRQLTQSLPADTPDSLLELAVELTMGFDDSETCFRLSMDALLRGLEPEPASPEHRM